MTDAPNPDDVPSVLESRFESPAALAAALAESVAGDLRKAIDLRGSASLVVSGGSTPLPFFQALSRQLLPWSKVWITLADERWVDSDDDASNHRFVAETLLQGEATEAVFVPLKNDAASPAQGADAAARALRPVPRPFDIVVLGMGTDGHIASLFPGAPGVEEGLDPQGGRVVVAVDPPTAAHPRLSLGLAALLDSRRIVLHITGEDKWQVYRRALGHGPVAELPVRGVLGRGREPIDVYWAP
ncbi:MAG: 6-phosphogluconolactonase [Acidobacteriota bacterium]